MLRIYSIIAFVVLFTCMSFAQAPTDLEGQGEQNFEEQVNALLELSPSERRAVLKGMEPSERRGLWFQLKKEAASRNGIAFNRDKYRNARKIKPGPNFKTNADRSKRAPGTITYDSGAFSTSFGGGSIVGNRFDTHTGIPVFANGSVDTVQAVVVQGSAFTTSSAGFVLLGPQTGGGGAMAIFSTFTAATGATATVTFNGIAASYTGSSFYVLFGDFSNSYVPAFGTGTTNAQGHHGVVGYTGGMGPNITGTANLGGTLNAFVRATGNIVPVELMKFEVK